MCNACQIVRQVVISTYVLTISIKGVAQTVIVCTFFFQAEDGIRDTDRSRGLGDVYKRQVDYTGI